LVYQQVAQGQRCRTGKWRPFPWRYHSRRR